MAKKDARVLPHNIEAEQSVLGCVMIDGDAGFAIIDALKTNDFYVEAHQLIFDAMGDVQRQNKPIDFITLTDELDKNGLMDKVGGAEYITTLTNIVPSASNHKHYIEIVKRDSVLRQLISASQEIINTAYEGVDKNKAIAFAEKNIFEIGKNEERSSLTPMKDTLDEVISKFETLQKDKGNVQGVPTGFYGLDKLTNGFQKSDLILIAARPGFGKTSLGMNIVNYAAIKGKKKCAVFSLEMPKIQIAQRSLCSVAYVDMGKALKGELTVKEWKELWAAKEQLAHADIFVDDSSQNTPFTILSKCMKIQREQGLDLIMIDYLQLMSSGNKRVESRQVEISEITRNLKIAAKELNVPIILLSQLSRAVEGRAGHKPVLSDLRESGAIEQDADMVIFIHRPDQDEQTVSQQTMAQLVVAKHRNGACEDIPVRWISNITTFKNLERDANAQSLEASAPADPMPSDKDIPADLPEITPLDESDIIDDIF